METTDLTPSDIVSCKQQVKGETKILRHVARLGFINVPGQDSDIKTSKKFYEGRGKDKIEATNNLIDVMVEHLIGLKKATK